ncbi:Peroxisomal carnitine O-octanoyltransferase [Heterocephalus glaber]|uniref:Peroxisomal carnitine O-octanoyltransferase n=1 Tax=Heterocephalus glaber TaxID=10181 RepID=G5AJW8_HETGA|nr:Peroxisomal carnitine O-octanoyltransferase [Heterocephalus glaber]
MENQLAKSTEERTFQYQDSLPSLPVPSLEESLKKYLESVKPFANEEEYKKTEEIVTKFKNGIGGKLQQKLLERAKGKRNWLEEWWLNAAYLDVRTPSQLNVNFAGPSAHFEHYWPPEEGAQLDRGSIILWHNLNYWQLLRKEKMPVHKVGGIPLDMNQFRMLFSTCKVPGVTRDSIMNYFRTGNEGHSPSHVAVLCRGRVFVFDALHEGCLITPPELLRHLTYIHEKCQREPPGPGVAALTTEERTLWAKAREYLISLDPENLGSLERIQSSLFVYSMEDSSAHVTPEDYSQILAMVLTGDPTVRWGDKSYNLISFSNGIFGCNCDHAPYDAMVMVNVAHYVDERILETEGRWKGSEKVQDIPLPEELVFTVDEKILNDIKQAKAQFLQEASDLQVVAPAFTSFGKRLTKKHSLHPDTFIQLALQLAYYRLHGRSGTVRLLALPQGPNDMKDKHCEPIQDIEAAMAVQLKTLGKEGSRAAAGSGEDDDDLLCSFALPVRRTLTHGADRVGPSSASGCLLPTQLSAPSGEAVGPSPGCCYETAMTRYFYHGRTETMRSCTVEAVRWCQSMQDPSASLFEQQQQMLEAFAKHNKMMNECSAGKGFDRHLLGLSLLAKEEGLPVLELFMDPLFSRSGGGGNFILSTSLIGYLRIQGVVVPMVHSGYGFFYHIRDDRFIVACSAWRSCLETDAEKLVEHTFRAFHDMMRLMNTAHL